MDGTILEEDSSWVALHRHFGTTRTGKRGLKLYTDGKIDYTEFMRRDIASWPKNLAIDEVDRILSKYRIRKEAPETVNRLKDLGAKVTLVTSGIDILAERVARDLGIESWVANGLETTSSGRLAGTGIGRVDPSRKDIAYLRLLRRLGIRREYIHERVHLLSVVPIRSRKPNSNKLRIHNDSRRPYSFCNIQRC